MAPADRAADRLVALAIFGVCLAAYVATLTPGMAYPGGDGQELTLNAATLGLAHKTGYPLFTWLGFAFTRLVPIGDAAHRTNLMSATLGAASVALSYRIGRELGVERIVAAFAALLFGVSTSFWAQAVVTEVYAPNACLVASTLFLALRWARYAERPETHARAERLFPRFALVYGLSLGTHLSNLGFAPAYALFALLIDPRILARPRTVARAVALFLLGAAQFLWLPLRAGAVDVFPNAPPDTLARFYAYTLGAFPELRFMYPLGALPARVSLYLTLLARNFGTVGIGLGVVGLCTLWWRDLPRFWLLFGMYAVHVAFFSQFGAPDVEVFFIPSLLVFAVCIGVGTQAVIDGLRSVLRAPRAVAVALALVLFLPLLDRAQASFIANDQSTDTIIPDFYRSALALLPERSVLVAGRGAFGADLFYFRRVLRLRPDLVLPMERGAPPAPAGAPLFTTPQALAAGPFGPPRGTFPEDAWYVPVLLGNRRAYVLYRVQTSPPPLVVADAAPALRIDRTVGGTTLLGVDPVGGGAPGRVHVKSYWRVAPGRPPIVSTRVGTLTLEAHELGLGNLERYGREVRPAEGGVVVEDVSVVLPSHLARGRYPLQVGVVELDAHGIAPRWLDAGQVTVE